MNTIFKISAIVLAGSVLLTPGTTTSEAAPSLRPLSLYPSAISADGTVVVGGHPTSSGAALEWTASGGTVALGNFFAAGISADGSVIVGYRAWHVDGGGVLSQAYRWTADTGSINLGTLPGDGRSEAHAVSADGSLVVGTSVLVLPDEDNDGGVYDACFHAIRWTPQTGMVALGVDGEALDASGDGGVIVGRRAGQAFRWSGQTGAVDLGFLTGHSQSMATGVSDDGAITIGVSKPSTGLRDLAFRWSAGTGLRPLGTLPGRNSSGASDVSADGSLIVGSSYSQSYTVFGGFQAFIWDEANGMRHLSQVLDGMGVDVAGWQLQRATGISADGLTIVGIGIDPFGQQRGWIATIPEPATLPLLGLGALPLRRRRRASDSSRTT
jgi:uncharacterized membrane protein